MTAVRASEVLGEPAAAGRAAPRLAVRGLLHDGGATVVARGDLVAQTVPRLLAACAEILACRPPTLVVDGRGVRTADHAAVDALLRLARARDVDLRVHLRRGTLLDLVTAAPRPFDVVVDDRRPGA